MRRAIQGALLVAVLSSGVAGAAAQSEEAGEEAGAPQEELEVVTIPSLPAPTQLSSGVVGELGDPHQSALDGSTTTWDLDDGADPPWHPVSPPHMPEGPAILGVQLRLGGAMGASPSIGDGPTAELSAVFDVRYGGGPFHLRTGLGLEVLWAETTNTAARPGPTHPSPLAIRYRLLPLAVDFGPAVALRMGGDIGLWFIDVDERASVEFLFGGHSEIAWRPRELDGLLEVAFYVGVHFRGSRTAFGSGYTAQAIFGLQLLWTLA